MVFFPVTLVLYFLFGRKNVVLLIASFVFYWWGEQWFIMVLLTSIAINYFSGLLIEKRKNRKGNTAALFLGIAGNLLLLCFFKYSTFIIENINPLITAIGFNPMAKPTIHLPLGISFFTFQALSYLVDLYRDQVKVQRNPLVLGLYISLFPQLIAGPIVRYSHISEALLHRRVKWADFIRGIERLIVGLSKKLIVADTLAVPADYIFSLNPDRLSSPMAWVGVLCFTFQIYFDFSGYSDMAIGLGQMFGFKFLENFNYPYISKSITEFWKRWHISLSTWLRDYLFLPIAYATMRKIKGPRMWAMKTEAWGYGTGMVVTMFLGGLWHGASWNFVTWGLFHGFFVLLERAGLGKKLKKLWFPLQNVYTLVLIIISWVLFRTHSFPAAIKFLKAMFSFRGWSGASHQFYQFSNNYVLVILVVAAVFSLPVGQYLDNWANHLRQQIANDHLARWFRSSGEILYGMFLCFMAFICFATMSAHTYKAFIYFRF
jgi:alginate O-acetyltransferase complex protein AlgI